MAQFTGSHDAFPTAALAALRFDIEEWEDLALMSVPVVTGIWSPQTP